MNQPKIIRHTLDETGEKIERTGSGLRESLFDQMERLRDGRVESMDARAFAALANALIKSVEVQITYEKLKITGHALPELDMVKPLSLNGDKGNEKA